MCIDIQIYRYIYIHAHSFKKTIVFSMNNVTYSNDWELNFSFTADLTENWFKEGIMRSSFINGLLLLADAKTQTIWVKKQRGGRLREGNTEKYKTLKMFLCQIYEQACMWNCPWKMFSKKKQSLWERGRKNHSLPKSENTELPFNTYKLLLLL